MPREIPPADLRDLCERYRAGTPYTTLARELRMRVTDVRDVLKVAGVTIRDRRACRLLQWDNLTPDERLRQVEAAHAAMRGVSPPRERVERQFRSRAQTLYQRGTFVGRGEDVLERLLCARGLSPIPQFALDRYNLDLALAPIAVEVLASPNHPFTDARLRQRAKQLTDWGWTTLYVWVTRGYPLSERAADQIVALVQLTQRDPTAVGKHWVIRGTGEFVARRNDGYQLTDEPPLVGMLNLPPLHNGVSGEA